MPLHPEHVRELSTLASTTNPLSPIMPMPASPVSIIADSDSVGFGDPDIMGLPVVPGDEDYEKLQELQRESYCYNRIPAEGLAPSTPASALNPFEPIMPLVKATRWLGEYFDREPAFTPGDDLGTCFYSYAAVMLCAMVIGTESPVVLAGVTSYPAPFVAAVLNSMRRNDLWDLENVCALKALLKETPPDWKEIQDAVRDAMEGVWCAVWSPEARIALESLRRGVLFGGKTQSWLDEDAAEFFDLA